MPPRLNKRQQREQEELLALSAPDPRLPSDESDGDPEPVEVAAPSASAFAALMGDGQSEDDTDGLDAAHSKSSSTKKKTKKKKKKAPASTLTASAPEPGQPSAPDPEQSSAPAPEVVDPAVKKERKAAKKARAKANKDGKDELDRALEELSIKYPDIQPLATPSASSAASSASLHALLSVAPQHLDAEVELRKFFGAKVLAGSANEGGAGRGRGSRRQAQSSLAARSILAKPKPTWFSAASREGLTVRALTPEEMTHKAERNGWGSTSNPIDAQERWWTVEYSKKYRGATKAFMQSVMSGDPENFWRLLSKMPWHADTLLQLAEGYRYREEHAQAMDFTDRALFTYERAFVGAFSLTNGQNRLDFDHVENRPLFLALHRQVSDLQRRGCFRTAFEFAKLVYSLDTASDPHGALLHLDFLALKTRQELWLLDMWAIAAGAPQSDSSRGRMNPCALPSWCYSHALALWMTEEAKHDAHEKSTAALRDAIIAFPSVVPLLADKADISLSGEVRSHKAFRIHTDASSLSTEREAIQHLLSHLYAQRAADLWKAGSISTWFSETVVAVLPTLSTSPGGHPLFEKLFEPVAGLSSLWGFGPSQTKSSPLAFSVYRHVIVLESAHRSLLGFIPRAVTNGTTIAGDPVPPPTRVNEYNAEFFKGAEDAFMPQPRNSARMLEQLIPDPVFRGQITAFFDAHPQIAERFPGGINQFVQMIAQLPEEAIEDLMIHAADGHDIGLAPPPQARGMPGDLLDQDEVEVEWIGADEAEPIDGIAARENHEGHPEGDTDNMDDADGEDDEDVAALPVRLLRGVMNRFWGAHDDAGSETSEEDEAEGAPG